METTVSEDTSWKQMYRAWRTHDCESDSDVCACRFDYLCPKCGRRVTTIGEEMIEIRARGGVCEHCLIGDK